MKSRIIIPVYILQPSEVINIKKGKRFPSTGGKKKALWCKSCHRACKRPCLCCAYASFLGRAVSVLPTTAREMWTSGWHSGFLCSVHQGLRVHLALYLNGRSVLLSDASLRIPARSGCAIPTVRTDLLRLPTILHMHITTLPQLLVLNYKLNLLSLISFRCIF